MKVKDNQNYDDIIHLQHPTSKKYPRMSSEDRAAQFSSFKALTGLEEEIEETGRLTDVQVKQDESAKESINTRLQIIQENISNSNYPLVRILYFKPDEKKSGGAYINISEEIKKVDEISKCIQTISGLMIRMEDIYALEGAIFERSTTFESRLQN